eukprot:9106099-Alexandrium_andersonii.AAC.1
MSDYGKNPTSNTVVTNTSAAVATAWHHICSGSDRLASHLQRWRPLGSTSTAVATAWQHIALARACT